MLPNILQCTSQSPTTKNYFTQNVNIAHIVKPENPSPQLILFPCTLIFLVNLVMELIRPLSSIYFSCVFKWKMPLKQDVFVLSCFSTQLLACPVFNLSFFFKVAQILAESSHCTIIPYIQHLQTVKGLRAATSWMPGLLSLSVVGLLQSLNYQSPYSISQEVGRYNDPSVITPIKCIGSQGNGCRLELSV